MLIITVHNKRNDPTFIHIPIYRVFVEKGKIIQQVILENKTNSIIMIRKYGEAYFSIYK